jgi:imidazolonepropionase-like amidohydrolase
MQIRKTLSIFSLVVLFITANQAYAQDTSTLKTVLTNCVIINCAGDAPMEEMTLVITDNTITEIRKGSYRQTPGEKNVRVFDLEGAYVLPGFWDNHSHISDLNPDVNNTLDYEPVLPAAIRAGRMAIDALQKGITTLRMVAERDYLDVAWGKAFDAGVFVGPRIISSGPSISSTHGDGYAPPYPGGVQVNGPDEVREAVRKNIRFGAGIIKIQANVLDRDEIKAAIETAHSFGIPVTAHSSEKAVRIAVELGIDCIEHGYGLSDETIQLMAEKGTFFDPTISAVYLNAENIAEREQKIAELNLNKGNEIIAGRTTAAFSDEQISSFVLNQRNILRKAVKAGVRVLTGADGTPVGEQVLLEIEQQVLSGLTEMQVLINATRNSADMMGMLDDIGTVEKGKLADLIVIEDNPLEHISNIRKLKMVIKDGKIVNLAKDEGLTSLRELYYTKR